MDAETIAQLLGKAWSSYGQWKANQERQDLAAKVKQIQAELDAMRLHATIKQAAEIDALESALGSEPRFLSSEENRKRTQRAGRAEAKRLRTVLIADPYNSQVRRLYLASRTDSELEQDKAAGKAKGVAMLPGVILGLAILGACIGFAFGVTIQKSHFLGIPTGSEIKSVNPVPIMIFAVMGGLIGLAFKPLLASRCESLWGEVGPVPNELANKGADKIKKRLFEK